MNQIARRDWLPERARWWYLAHSGPPAVSREKNFPESQKNKSFIDQAFSVKMAGYWPRSFFARLWTSTPTRSTSKHVKKETWPIIFSHLTEQALSISRIYNINTFPSGRVMGKRRMIYPEILKTGIKTHWAISKEN